MSQFYQDHSASKSTTEIISNSAFDIFKNSNYLDNFISRYFYFDANAFVGLCRDLLDSTIEMKSRIVR